MRIPKLYFTQNCRTKRRFKVVELTQDLGMNFTVLQKLISKSQLLGAKFKDGRMFEFNQNYKQGFYIHKAENLDVKVPVKLQKGKGPSYNMEKFNLGNEDLSQLYDSSAKLQDIKDLLPYVPLPWSRYLTNILEKQRDTRTSLTQEDGEDNDDDLLDYA